MRLVKESPLHTSVSPQSSGSEQAVSTHVLSRNVIESRVAQAGGLFQIGPYLVLEALTRAPGAWIVKAQNADGELFILQLTHCRAAEGEDAEVKRQYFEHTIQKATATLVDEPNLLVKAHGGADRADGTRVLFWALPWRPDAEHLRNPLRHLESLTHVLQLGISLSQRMARRHEQDRLEPALCEQLILVRKDGLGAELIGVPVFLRAEWLTPDMLPPRNAPEELLPGAQPQKTADLWRLGHTLDALCRPFEPLPAQLRALLDALTNADPAQRPRQATDVIVELEMFRQALARGQIKHTPGAETVSAQKILPEDLLSDMLLSSLGGYAPMPPELPTAPSREADPHRLPTERVQSSVLLEAIALSNPSSGPGSEAITLDTSRRSIAGPIYAATIVDDFDSLPEGTAPQTTQNAPQYPWAQDLPGGAEDPTMDTSLTAPRVVEGLPASPPPKPQLVSKAERDTDLDIEPVRRLSSIVVTPVAPNTQPSSQVASHPPGTPEVATLPETFELPTSPSRPRLEADSPSGATGGYEPITNDLLPESQPTDRGAAPAGPVDDQAETHPLTQSVPPQEAQIAPIEVPSALPSPSQEPEPAAPPAASEIAGDIPSSAPLNDSLLKAALPRRSPARWLLLPLLLLSAAGVYFLAQELSGRLAPPSDAPAAAAVEAHPLKLTAEPAEVRIISETDGRTLGAPPMSLMIPQGVSAAVLLVARGHQPQRLVLPDRGQIGVALAARDEPGHPCEIPVSAEGTILEGVLTEIEKGDAITIPGAAIVKLKRGRAQSARLLRCPSPGGTAKVETLSPTPQPEVEIQVDQPEGAKLYIDGASAGRIPAKVKVEAGFHQLEVQSQNERRRRWWVPALVNVRIDLERSTP